MENTTGTLSLTAGLFIDGGYYVKINEALRKQSGVEFDLKELLIFLREVIARQNGLEIHQCQIPEAHYFRGRFKVHDAQDKQLLYSERKFEDALIENDIQFHYKHLREIDGRIIEKGIDVWFALEALGRSFVNKFDYVILITGDADHEMLIKKLQALKIRVILLTGDFTRHSSTSHLLSEEATTHIELSEWFAKDKSLIRRICK